MGHCGRKQIEASGSRLVMGCRGIGRSAAAWRWHFNDGRTPVVADGFFIFGFGLLLVKFASWEEARSHSRWVVGVCVFGGLAVCIFAIAGNHLMNAAFKVTDKVDSKPQRLPETLAKTNTTDEML
jgi:peptidoglycan/LPS O-acetylase OafA/YrhL